MPLIHALESDGTATFYCTEGLMEKSLPFGYEEFFGPPPNKTFQTDGVFAAILSTVILSTVINSTYPSLEDAIYALKDDPGHGAILEAIETLSHLLEAEGPFDGILGFSEGSCLAATLLADHLEKSRRAGKDSIFKLGVFWGGVPPFTADGKRWYLPRHDGQVLDLPTIHVIGATDPFLAAGMLLHNLCKPASATLFDHGKGHQIVWESKIVKSLVEVIREQIRATECK